MKAQLGKKIFLVASTVIVAIACIVYIFVIFGAFEHRKEMAQLNIGEEIIDIHKGVPRGWGYSILTDPKQVGALPPLGRALAQVNFSLPELNEKLGGEIQKRTIYFYPVAMENEVRSAVDEEVASDAQCPPQLYARTAAYYIMSSPCDAFQGKQYSEIERKLKMELEEFWFKHQ